jgi:hypothetical protein
MPECRCRKCGTQFNAPLQAKHRLLCGDARNRKDVERLFAGAKANVAIDGSNPHKTAIGFGEASELGLTTFAGESITGPAILLKYTLNGDANLDGQLALFCSSQSDPKKCLATGLPFTSEMYDFVVSMGSSHVAIEDLATRVLFDGTTFGEFSRQHREIFASLKGRQFDTLDCHSNGAMLCLAALRSGETTAKEVRLFAPQMNPEAAKRWQEYAANTRTTIKIYLNYGDPVTAISWKQPAPQTAAGKAVTAAWLSNPVTGPATLADALFYSYFDSKTGVMDATLKHYGFDVMRSKCNDSPSLDCHSMKLYEKQLHEKNGEPRAK